MNYTCKICGGTLSIEQASGIAICDYCGTKQTLPQFTDESAKHLYDRGNNYLLHNEYDKAENMFAQLLSINPQDAELYWDLVLCKYGVTYVCDPKTGKYIPTCNRTHYVSIFNDENYLKALQYSTGEKNELYKADAKTIDAIQKGILAVSKKEKPFDIFISYKETNAEGTRTKDSVVAQELYEKLTDEGYKVFFSRITLEDKIGTEYEPYIYAALSSSKVMLTISSSKENIEAAWVKNEWSRYLTLRQQDSSKTLIPLYFDMEKSDLPEEFAILASQDMKKEGFEQELIRGIKKLIPLPIMKAQRRKKNRKIFTIVALLVIAMGIISAPFISKNIKYENALSFFDEEKYEDAAKAFEELGDFKNAKEMQRKSVELNAKLKVYEETMQLYYDGNYPEAAWAFKKLVGFKDAEEMQDNSERAWRESLATIATDNVLGSSSCGSYYISSNGTVETFNYDPGVANEGIEINQHGKIVSIADHYELYALYEDGYVYNSAKNNQIDTDWGDVIQITPVFNETNVALKSDGTVVCGEIQKEYGGSDTDSWLQEVSTWKNIVSLSWDLSRFGYGGLEYAVLVGVDVEGKVHSLYYCNDNDSAMQSGKQVLESLNNISKVEVYCNRFTFDGFGVDLDFAALDKDNRLITYFNGESNIIDKFNYRHFEIQCWFDNRDDLDYETKIFVTDNKKNLFILDSDSIIMEDVVHFSERHIITQSGSIYHDYNDKSRTPESTEGKTQVRDIWLEGN